MIDSYRYHLKITADWIQKSFHNNSGGSSAHYADFLGWSKSYPETTGYIITTLIELSKFYNNQTYYNQAVNAGNWLQTLQNKDGSFPSGLINKNETNPPSVFNTGQIIDGLTELYLYDSNTKWLMMAENAANWLCNTLNEDGFWDKGNYKSKFNPSYYSQVAWPILKVYKINNSDLLKNSSKIVLSNISRRLLKNGVINDWGFEKNSPAFTHTIAYTIRGFIESAIILNDWENFGSPIEKSINKLYRQAEINAGALPGMYDNNWKPDKSFVCLTGNAQIAICFLRYEKMFPDLRLVNASIKLVDYVCNQQKKLKNYKLGSVAGSKPLWGKYMKFRYPNWAAKYHADSLILLMKRLEIEKTDV